MRKLFSQTRRRIMALVAAALWQGTVVSRPAEAQSLAKEIRDYWLDPVAAFTREASRDKPNLFEPKPVAFTAAHLGILRQSVLTWDPTESGASAFAPEKPFGRLDPLPQLATAFGITGTRALARKHVEMMFALGALLQHGQLAPGRYAPRNTTIAALRSKLLEPGGALVAAADLALADDGTFAFTADHRTLLRHMAFDWPSRGDVEDILERGAEHPFALFDTKRPYGTLSNYPVDIAHRLGRRDILQREGSDGAWIIADAQRVEMIKLHRQMLFAMQVFLENAELKPGRYIWKKE